MVNIFHSGLRGGCWSLSQLLMGQSSVQPLMSHQLIAKSYIRYVDQGYLSSTPLATRTSYIPCLQPRTLHFLALSLTDWGTTDPFMNIVYKMVLVTISGQNIMQKTALAYTIGTLPRDAVFLDLLIICNQQSNFTGNYLHSQHCKQKGERLHKILPISTLFAFFNLHSYLFSTLPLSND